MKPEKQQLFNDLLGDQNHREATLLAGARAMRRRRKWRMAGRTLGVFALVIGSVLWLKSKPSRQAAPDAAAAATKPFVPELPPRALTDDELLALFPDTPVGLATLADGRKRLIFPRPGDERKFVTRL